MLIDIYGQRTIQFNPNQKENIITNMDIEEK